MTTRVDSWGHGYQPDESVWRAADLFVLALVVLALFGGAILRMNNFGATQQTAYEGMTFNVPRGTIVEPGEGTYSARTTDGLAVNVQTLDVPPIGAEDVGALATTRALQLAQNRQLFQSIGTDQVDIGGQVAGVMEYEYVVSNSAQFFSSGLQVVDGYELLVVNGDRLYALSLEGPSEKRAELDALWSQILSSVRFGG